MLTIITKCTEYCNSNCVYCAVRDKETKREKMSLDLLRTLIERVHDYLLVDDERQVNITWHGGEPLLMGPDFYRAAHMLQQEILGPNASRLRYSMQSNITLLDEPSVQVLKLLGMEAVGTSYEYTPGLRGIGPSRDSDQYTREFFRGLQLLHKHGMSAGCIFVVTSHTVDAPVETLTFMCNLLGKKSRGHLRLNCLYKEGEASRDMHSDLQVTPEQFGHFLGKAYQFWYPRRHLLYGVAPFQAISKAINGEKADLSCEESGLCGNTHLSVSPVGEVFQCGRAMDNGSMHYGNIRDKGIDEMFAHPLKQELMNRSQTLRAGECAGCVLWEWCHGGCPVDSFIYHRNWLHKTYFCRTKQVFLGEYVLPLHEEMKGKEGCASC